MPLPNHPFRTWLFVPGDNERKLQKAADSDADVVIFDLEDAVTPGNKEAARSSTRFALESTCRPVRYVRVNDLSTGATADDIAAIAGARPDGYVLPKCEGPEDVQRLVEIARSQGHEAQSILAICTETTRGVRKLMREDWSHPALVGLTWGGEDLQADLGGRANRTPTGEYLSLFSMVRDLTLLAAREANVIAIDAVFVDFKNEAGLVDEVQYARSVGFDGKMAIHPSQVRVIREHMAPTSQEIEWARRVVQLLEGADAGVVQHDGKMLDRPHLAAARKMLFG